MKWKNNFDLNPGNDDSASLFIKLKDKEIIHGIFRGDPEEFWAHWTGNGYADCTGPGCEYCRDGDKAKFRFRINFVIKEGGAYVAKILEQGRMVAETLQGLAGSGYELERTAVSIQRFGTRKNDTSYTILPLPPAQQPTQDALKKIAAVNLNPLRAEAKEEEESVEPGPDERDLPF